MKNFIFAFSIALLGCQTNEETEQSLASLWGEAGAQTYPQSAEKMRKSHPPGQSLSKLDKETLRSYFKDLVDKVRIHWNATPLNELAAEQYSISVVGEYAEAQTYGYDIYMTGEEKSRPVEHQLEVLSHELIHVQQFERFGSSLSDFGYFYFKEYYLAGQSYADNSLEVECDKTAKSILAKLLSNYSVLKSNTIPN